MSTTSRIPAPRSSQLRPPTKLGSTNSFSTGSSRVTDEKDVAKSTSSISSARSSISSSGSGNFDVRSVSSSDFSKSMNFENGLLKQSTAEATNALALEDVQSSKRPSTMSDIRKMVRNPPSTGTISSTTATERIIMGGGGSKSATNSEKVTPSISEPMLRRDENSSLNTSSINAAAERAVTPSKLTKLELAVKKAIQTSSDVIVEPTDTSNGPSISTAPTTTSLSSKTSLHDRFASVAADNQNNSTRMSASTTTTSSSSSSNNGSNNSRPGSAQLDSTGTETNAYATMMQSNNTATGNILSRPASFTQSSASASTATSSSAFTSASSTLPTSTTNTNQPSISLPSTQTTSASTTAYNTLSRSPPPPSSSSSTVNPPKLSMEELIQSIQSSLLAQQQALQQSQQGHGLTIPTLYKTEEDSTVWTSLQSTAQAGAGRSSKEEEIFAGVTMQMFEAQLTNMDFLSTPTIQHMNSQVQQVCPSSTRKLLTDEDYDEMDKLLSY